MTDQGPLRAWDEYLETFVQRVPRYAVKVLREGDFLEESDQIIDRQINLRTMSEWVGYANLDDDARECLDITT